MRPDLTLSIISSDNLDLLLPCLRSVFENTHHITLEVYVVDNASADDGAAAVKAAFPRVQVVCNEVRQGFSTNNNIALRQGQGRYLMLLNDDTRVLNGALDCLVRHSAKDDDIEIVWVPGSFEIPMAADVMAKSQRFDCVVCLGALVRGSTPHFDYIAAEATKGIAQVSLDTGIPVTYGIITADTLEQAIERAGTKAGNKGWDAALSGIEMADLYTKLKLS